MKTKVGGPWDGKTIKCLLSLPSNVQHKSNCMKRSNRNRRKTLLRKGGRKDCTFFYECLKQCSFQLHNPKNDIVYGGRSATPNTRIPTSWAQNGSSGNCREERLYVKIKVWSKVIAHELKNNELLGHPVFVFADVLVTKKSNKCFSRWISKV